MKISYLPPHGDNASTREIAITIGSFDGIHRGHQSLIRTLNQVGELNHLEPVFVTFHPHPRSVVDPSSAPPKLLTLASEKYVLCQQLGVAEIADLQFTLEMSHLKADEFLAQLGAFGVIRHIIVGPDFRMGYQAHANAQWIEQYCDAHGIVFHLERAEQYRKEEISSTAIRQVLEEGDVARANRLLGYSYSMTGTVVHGEGVGKSLGVPTANLATHPDKCLPGDGVYSTWAFVDGFWRKSTTSIGVRPTFAGTARVLEVHLHGYDEDLYGTKLTVMFVQKIRNQKKFDRIEPLIETMQRDIEKSSSLLDAEPGSSDELVLLPHQNIVLTLP